MALQRERILILAKTYPSPSASYIETSCVAGINANGEMRRLFPVPFRLLEDDQQFSKWQWIDARVEKARGDHRPESFRIDVGTLACGEKVSTHAEWQPRREWIRRIPQFEAFSELENWSGATKGSLALLKPRELTGLSIVPARKTAWSEEEILKLTRAQGGVCSRNPKQGTRSQCSKSSPVISTMNTCVPTAPLFDTRLSIGRRVSFIGDVVGTTDRTAMRSSGRSCWDQCNPRT